LQTQFSRNSSFCNYVLRLSASTNKQSKIVYGHVREPYGHGIKLDMYELLVKGTVTRDELHHLYCQELLNLEVLYLRRRKRVCIVLILFKATVHRTGWHRIVCDYCLGVVQCGQFHVTVLNMQKLHCDKTQWDTHPIAKLL
jgi:hypothetical protein